eukprot:363804-Chlamydomonas_euryale.AAC.4
MNALVQCWWPGPTAAAHTTGRSARHAASGQLLNTRTLRHRQASTSPAPASPAPAPTHIADIMGAAVCSTYLSESRLLYNRSAHGTHGHIDTALACQPYLSESRLLYNRSAHGTHGHIDTALACQPCAAWLPERSCVRAQLHIYPSATALNEPINVRDGNM